MTLYLNLISIPLKLFSFRVYCLYLLANQLKVVAKLLHLAVHLVDKAVALLRTCVKETEVVLVSLNFLAQLVATTHQSSALRIEGILATLSHVLEVRLEVVKTATLGRHIESLVNLVEHSVILLIELILLLVRHMPHLAVFIDNSLHLVACQLGSILGKRAQLLYD